MPSNGMEIKIKCGVRFDEFFIGMDVDDDDSLRFVIDNSKVIMAYILKYVPPPPIRFSATQREDRVPPSTASLFPANDMFWERLLSPDDHHHGEGINLTISNHEDDKDSEVHMQEDSQFPSQVRQTVRPSEVDVCLLTAAREPAHSESSHFGFALAREFPDINALRNALSDMAIITGRKYEHVRTTPTKLVMKCRESSCGWLIHAARLSKLSPTFTVVKYQEVHTCTVVLDSGNEDHTQATVRWILSKVQSILKMGPHMEPSRIVKEFRDWYDMEPSRIVEELKYCYGIKISYNKAVKAKTKALEVMRNWLKEMNLVRDLDMCRALKEELERDGTTICEVGVNSDGGSFQHFFWSFQACIYALHNHLRPVVCVGSVNTKIGVLMYASGIDCDKFDADAEADTVRVGFGIYDNREEEKSSMWERYLGWLKQFVLPAAAAGIPFSINTAFEEKELTGIVEKVLPHLHHFFYPQSLRCELCDRFEDDDNQCGDNLCDLSTEECEAALQKMKSINKEAYSWLLSSSVGSKSHWACSFFPNKHARGLGPVFDFNEIEYMLEILIRENLSIVEMVENTRDMVEFDISMRESEREDEATTGLAPALMREIRWAKYSLPKQCKVKPIDGPKYQVSNESYQPFEEVVDLEEKSCTCGQFQAKEYPCEHAIVAIVHLDLNVRNYFSHQWYSLDTYCATTYAGNLPPPIPDYILQLGTGLPPKRRVGRPRKFKRRRQETV